MKAGPISEQESVTFLTETILNSSDVSDDVNDFDLATTNHFTLGKHLL